MHNHAVDFLGHDKHGKDIVLGSRVRYAFTNGSIPYGTEAIAAGTGTGCGGGEYLEVISEGGTVGLWGFYNTEVIAPAVAEAPPTPPANLSVGEDYYGSLLLVGDRVEYICTKRQGTVVGKEGEKILVRWDARGSQGEETSAWKGSSMILLAPGEPTAPEENVPEVVAEPAEDVPQFTTLSVINDIITELGTYREVSSLINNAIAELERDLKRFIEKNQTVLAATVVDGLTDVAVGACQYAQQEAESGEYSMDIEPFPGYGELAGKVEGRN